MKKYLLFSLFLIIALLCLTCTNRGVQTDKLKAPEPSVWIKTNGPSGGYINDIAIDPDNPHILYAAGSRKGIYKSLDKAAKTGVIKKNAAARKKSRVTKLINIKSAAK